MSVPPSDAQAAEHYRRLLEIGVDLSSSLEPVEVLERAMVQAEELCRAETSSVWEVDELRGDLFFRLVRGSAAGEIRDLRVPRGKGIVGDVADTGVGEIVNDVRADPRWAGDQSAEFETRAILAMPLRGRGRVVGVLQIINPIGREGFDGTDLERMRLFAGALGPAIENARLYTALKNQFLGTVTALAEAIEKRDPYTGGHVRRVVVYSLLLGFELGLHGRGLERLRLAATLHDVGKIGIPDQVLQKPAPLDDEERRIMERHTVDGAEIVARISELREVLPGVRSHHERLDGRGYPDGLTDAQIPEVARILAVADSFDAITTSRPYRAARPLDFAQREIVENAGAQFCPRVVEAFRRLTERGGFTVAAGEALERRIFGDREAAGGWYRPRE